MPTINLKEYADTRKISYDAVRKQIQRYRDLLGENIIKQEKFTFKRKSGRNTGL